MHPLEEKLAEEETEKKLKAAIQNSSIELDLSHPVLTQLPKYFAEAARSGKLDNLLRITIIGTPLKELPPEIGLCRGLSDLDIQHSELTTIPSEIESLKNLRRLIIGSSLLEVLPEALGGLSNLQTLILISPKLAHIPKWIENLSALRELHLLATSITELPTEIGLLPLKAFGVRQHVPGDSILQSLKFPPEDIYKLGGQAMLRYLRAAHSGCRDVWESKLLLVGEGWYERGHG